MQSAHKDMLKDNSTGGSGKKIVYLKCQSKK